MDGQYKSLVVYDVYNELGECVRTCNTMELALQYCQNCHQKYLDEWEGEQEEYEIKTVVRLYWCED